jgi:signal transduction histidine kinase
MKSITFPFPGISVSSKLAVRTLAVLLAIIIIDLLTTRQILPYTNTSEDILFVTTMVIISTASFILLAYTKHVIKEIYSRSSFVKTLFISVVLVTILLLCILWTMLFSNLLNCPYHFSLCDNTNYHNLINVISSIFASAILITISFKFFSWYKTNYKNFLMLLFGLLAVGMIISLVGDNINELLLTKTIYEKSPPGSVPKAFFLYKQNKKLGGEIQYQIVNPEKTTFLVRPTSTLGLSSIISQLTSYPHNVFRWFSVVLLLFYYHYFKTERKKFWILTAIPLVLFLIGSGFIFSLPSDSPYKFYLRLVYRAGNIGNSLLFGLIFYYIIKKIEVEKIKEYLIIVAMDLVMFDLAFSTSAYQPTYGIAVHSLVLLCACFISIGWYSMALSIAQDKKLRETIKKQVMDESKLLISIGSAQMEQLIQSKALKVAKEEEALLMHETGVYSSLTENGMKQYANTVLKEIKILEDIDQILKRAKEILNKSAKFLVCSGIWGLRLAYNNYFDIYENVMDRYAKQDHQGVRLVTAITDKNSVELVRKFLNIGVKIKHIKNMPPIDFSISDKEMIASIQKTEHGGENMIQNLLLSNEQPYIDHFTSIFEELWRNGVDADARIKAIQDGLDSEGIEIIQDPEEIQELGLRLVQNARREALVIYSTANAFHRQEYAGGIRLLTEAALNRGVKVRILTPGDDLIMEKIQKERQQQGSIDIRFIEPHSQTKVSILVVDREFSLAIELKDDTRRISSEAIGLATYSNSKSTVLSYASIFESLWQQAELSGRLKEMDLIKTEFINVAAHELRTPIQPILGLSQTLRSKLGESEYTKLLDIVIRNAKRLQRLTEDILDVAKIESRSLDLKRESFNLNEVLQNIIVDYNNQIAKDNKDDKLKLQLIESKKDIIIEADKERITQVISNLISNAIKFTNEGSITMSVGKTDSNDGVLVSIKDTGRGLDPEILPRLFTKFATKSEKGTGLGLFISKSIIEAHGGQIWAEKYNDGNGATFMFTLPMTH